MEKRPFEKLVAVAVLVILTFSLSSSTSDAHIPLTNPDPPSFSLSIVKPLGRWAQVSELTPANDELYFFGFNTELFGVMGLWVSDGTQAGTQEIKDLGIGSRNWTLRELTYEPETSTLFFTRLHNDGNRSELWISDGTEAGTAALVTEWPDEYEKAVAEELINASGQLFFRLSTGDSEGELWVSDGTLGGTGPLGRWGEQVRPRGFAEFNGELYFGLAGPDSRTGLWKSDGTGTTQVRSYEAGSSVYELTPADDKLFFFVCDSASEPDGLWVSDGTQAGTHLVKELGCVESVHVELIYVEETSTLFFTRSNRDANMATLWKSDGTEAGTEQTGFIYDGGILEELTDVNGTLFFRYSTGEGEGELWAGNGTVGGTTAISNWSNVRPEGLVDFKGELYFGLNGFSKPCNGLWKAAQLELQVPSREVVFKLERVRVVDLTGCFGDDDCYGNNDEPYFPMVIFRSRLYDPCSTQIELPNRLYEFASLDEDWQEPEGNEAEIPSDAGLVTFRNVHFSTLDSIAEGDFPEVLGVLVVGMEHEHSEDEVRDAIEDLFPDVDAALQEAVEQGGLVHNLADTLDSTSGDDEPGDDGEPATCFGIEEILEDLDTDWDPNQGQRLSVALAGWIIDSQLGGIIGYLLADPILQLYVDDFVDVHLFLYLTLKDKDLPDFNITCEANNRTIHIKLLQDEIYPLGYTPDEHNPLVFEGDEGKWEVQARVTTFASETQPPKSMSSCDTAPPSSTHRIYLPVIYKPGSGDFPDRSNPSLTTELWSMQYNVQFLLPWDEGAIPGQWPNTSQRAAAIGEALACYDIVGLNETVNNTRRGQILGTMQAKSPYCNRPESLAGDSSFTPRDGPPTEPAEADVGSSDELSSQSFFTIVDGPDISSTRLITGWVSALEAIRDNPGEPIAGNELAIVSRFPVVETNSHTFKHHYGIDGLTAKGVIHARVRVSESDSPDFIDVFATHLQAGHSEIRRCQILELADFIGEHADPANPVLLLGDFNVRGPLLGQQEDEYSDEYRYLMEVLNSLSSGHEIRDIGLHLASGTNHDSDPEEHRKKRIDYIFLSESDLTVSEDDVHILDFADPSGEKPTLSDHAAVAAIINRNDQDEGLPNGPGGAPDLIVEDTTITPHDVQVVIKNVGPAPLLSGNDFWVDLYINPESPPVAVNQIWEDLGEAGLVWGVSTAALYLAPGDELVLRINDDFYTPSMSRYPGLLPAGSRIYVQVDSANVHTDYGGVLETHEESHGSYNNISSITLTEAVSTSSWASITPSSESIEMMQDEILVTTPRK